MKNNPLAILNFNKGKECTEIRMLSETMERNETLKGGNKETNNFNTIIKEIRFSLQYIIINMSLFG